MIQTLELFGGIGAPRRALKNIGIDVKSIDYVEIDAKAVASYNAMFKNDIKYNAQNIIGWNLKPDILIHGSPCQDFSVAGFQKGADKGSGTRSSLMWETIRIIKSMGVWKPKVVIWENVKNVLSKYMVHNFNKYLEVMREMGYTNSFDVLNTLDFGLPQKRERVFTVSILGNEFFDFSDLIRKPYKNIKNYLEKDVPDYYTVTQPSMLKKIMNEKGKTASLSVPIIKDYAFTITTKQVRSPNSGVIDLGNGKYRYLTERECWRLQGFSDEDFDNALKANPSRKGFMNTALYKQAGNSISVPVFESIFRKLLLGETSEKKEDIQQNLF